jgi:hypothetical protein
MEYEMKTRKYIPQTEEQNIVKMYSVEKKTIKDISLTYGCSITPIWQILDRHNIPRIPHLERVRKINEQEVKEICELYVSGMNTPELAKKYNISTHTVNRFLRLNDTKIRLQKESKRTHKFKDEHFFDCIDTEAKAYFLGLLYTDGCNYIKVKNNTHINFVMISLQERDKHILDTFCDYIFGNNNILLKRITKKDFNRQDQYCLRIVSRHMSETLLAYGMEPRKGFTMEMPTCIPTPLFKHFVRGMWDGDGSIYYNTTSKSFGCSFIGSVKCCDELKRILSDEYGFNFHLEDKKNYSKCMSVLKTHGNNVTESFLTWMYSESDPKLRLLRKYEKYQDLLKLKNDIKERKTKRKRRGNDTPPLNE